MTRACIGLVLACCMLAASSAEASCRRGAWTTWLESSSKRTVKTSVVVCDGTRPRVIRRATLRISGPAAYKRYNGRLLTDADAAAGRLAIASIDFRVRSPLRAKYTGRVEMRSIKSRRLLYRRRVRVGPAHHKQPIEVVLTDAGDLVWSVPAYSNALAFVRRASGRVDQIPTRNGRELSIEDGHTLRFGWAGFRAFQDLRPPRLDGDGCPRRSVFRRIEELDGVLISRADYDTRRPDYALRACEKGSRRDTVLGSGAERTVFGLGTALDVVGVTRPFVLARAVPLGQNCEDGWLAVFDLRTGARGRIAVSCPSPDLPTRGDPVAFTSAGVPVWLRTGLVETLSASGRIQRLNDFGTATDLAVDGSVARWMQDGRQRSATVD